MLTKRAIERMSPGGLSWINWVLAVIGVFLFVVAPTAAANARKIPFHVPGGDAVQTLAEFARQSGEQIVYLVDTVSGEHTARVEGNFTSFEALREMLAGTRLAVHRDAATGAMIVARRGSPIPVSRASLPKPETAAVTTGDEIVKLPQFTVSGAVADRYRAADAVSAARVRANLLDTPSSISVLPRQVIDDLAPVRIFDVTRYLAGVEEGRGVQFSDRQIIRGFESNGRTVDNFFQTGADNIDEAVVDRIEISKGPNAILAPAGVPGGSINVITKSPQFVARRSVTALAGMFDAQKVTIDLTGPVPGLESVAYRVIASAQDSRQYWAADARLRGKVFAPMLSWRVAPQTELTLKLIAAEHWVYREPGLILDPRVGSDTADPYLAPGFAYRSRNGIQPWSHVGTHTVDAFTQLTSSLGEGVGLRVALNNRYYLEDSMQEFFSTPTFNDRYDPYTGELTQDTTWAPDPATGTYQPTHSPWFDPGAIPVRGDNQKTVTTTTNIQADIAARRQFRGVTSQTVVGVALSHFDTRGRGYTGSLPPLNLAHPEVLAQPAWSAVPYYDLRSRQNTQYAYIDQRLTFAGDRVQVSGGVLDYLVDAKSRSQLTTDPASVLDDSRWLGFGSVLFKPWRNVSLYYTHSTNSTPVIANDLPLWRDGVQDEFGIKSEFFEQRLALTLAQFRIRQTNVTVPNPDHQTDPNAPEQLISDLGDHGIELELTGGLTSNLSVIASYSELRLRDSLGRPVRAVSDHSAAALLNYRFREGVLHGTSVFAGVTYAGSKAGDATSVNFTPLGVVTLQSFRVPPTTTVDVGAAYKRGRWLFRWNVDNLLNQTNRLQQGGGRVSGTGLTSEPGTNGKISVTVEF